MREIWAVAEKDLRIELRSRIVASQVLPFALIVLILFGLALDADKATLRAFTPGLFWITVLFTSILTIQRSVAVEVESEAFESLRLAGTAPWRIFAGKALAVSVQLIAIEVVLAVGVIVLYRSSFEAPGVAAVGALSATVAIASAGSLYGVLAVGNGVRDTILPMLLLPVLAPVLIGATRAFDAGLGTAAVNGWAWAGLLGVVAIIYGTIGAAAYGVVLEDA